MTDLKTATQMLADAIAALESEQHDADCAEAEAIRNRLLILDAEIGKRIQDKLDAHRLIIDQWGVSEAVVPRKLEEADEPIVEITDPLAMFDAPADMSVAAWDAHHADAVGAYALSGDEVPEAVAVMADGVAEMPQVAQSNGQ